MNFSKEITEKCRYLCFFNPKYWSFHLPDKKANNILKKKMSEWQIFFFFFFFFFFNYYLAAPRPTSGHYRGDSLTHPMLITAFVHVRPEGHREPRSEVGSLSPAERLAGFEPGTFRFL